MVANQKWGRKKWFRNTDRSTEGSQVTGRKLGKTKMKNETAICRESNFRGVLYFYKQWLMRLHLKSREKTGSRCLDLLLLLFLFQCPPQQIMQCKKSTSTQRKSVDAEDAAPTWPMLAWQVVCFASTQLHPGPVPGSVLRARWKNIFQSYLIWKESSSCSPRSPSRVNHKGLLQKHAPELNWHCNRDSSEAKPEESRDQLWHPCSRDQSRTQQP